MLYFPDLLYQVFLIGPKLMRFVNHDFFSLLKKGNSNKSNPTPIAQIAPAINPEAVNSIAEKLRVSPMSNKITPIILFLVISL